MVVAVPEMPQKRKTERFSRVYPEDSVLAHLLTQHSAIVSDMPSDVPKELQEISH